MSRKHMDFKVLGRLLGYVIRHYKVACLFTLIFIILASLASVSVSLFIQVLIDDYITPLAQTDTPDFGPLLQILLVMLCVIHLTGVLSTFAYNRILVYIGTGNAAQCPR